MKRVLCFLVLFVLLTLAGCGVVKNAAAADWEPSEFYTDSEINAAMRAAKRVFVRRFDGCALAELAYSERWSSPEEITILASFDVDATGGPNGVLNPNSHYIDYKFTFTRGLFGRWKLADNGYA